MEECIFCKIVKGELNSERVFEDERFIVIKDVNPKVEGHLLVLPKEHYGNFFDLPRNLHGEFLGVVRDVVEKLSVKSFNLVLNNGRVAGQLIGHVHLHILPRREGDVSDVGGNHLILP